MIDRLEEGWWRSLGAPRGQEVELCVDRSRERVVSRAGGRPRDTLSGESAGAAVRVLIGGRRGFASGTDLSPAGLRRLRDGAARGAARLRPDPARALPEPSPPRGSPEPPDRRILARSDASLHRQLAALDRRVRGWDARVRDVLRLEVSETVGERWVMNSRGVRVHDRIGFVAFSVEVMGEKGRNRETAWGSREARSWDGLNPEATARDAVRRLGYMLGGGPLRTGVWPVVFSPRVGAELLGVVAGAAGADAVQKRRSWFPVKPGSPLGSPQVTILDHGNLSGGVAASLWDAEGVPTARTTVVEGGIFRSLLYDTETARRDGVSSTGNATRSGRDHPPSPGPTHFYMAPGSATARRLLSETPRAFWVWDLIGLHTADPVSGEFSVGAAGVLWEKGRVRRGVRGVTLSGTLGGLLSGVDAVANDLDWQGALGSPTFRVRGLTVGGC